MAVGKINQLVVRRGNLGVEDADLAHGAGFSADLDEIADLERVRGKKDHGAGKIGKRVLNGKRNGKTCNAQNGKQRRGVDAERACQQHDCQKHQHDFDGRSDEGMAAAVQFGRFEHFFGRLEQNFYAYNTYHQ